MNLVGIAGSLRRDSYNKKLLAAAARAAEAQGHALTIVDIGELPVLNQDDEKPTMPKPVEAFRAALFAADAIVFCTPEYNYSLPGGLKNAIDWGSRPPKNVFDQKVVAVMGATVGGFGTVNACRDLRHVMNVLNAIVVPQPFVYLSKAQEAFDDAGNLKDDKTAKAVDGIMARLIATTTALRG